MNSDPMLVSNGLTNYWLNMLLQQLCLSDPSVCVFSYTGSVPAPESLIGALSQTKPCPSPPPGLTLPSEGMRMGLKGTESRQLEKIPENEDLSGLSDENESPGPMTSELSDVMSQVRMMSRRSSLQGPEVCGFLNQGRRQSTGQAMTRRLLDGEMEGGWSERRNSLREMEGGRIDTRWNSLRKMEGGRSERRNSLREMEGARSERCNSLRAMEEGRSDTRRNSLREMEGGRHERRNSLRRDVTQTQDTLCDASRNEDYDYEMKKLLATQEEAGGDRGSDPH
ncbi:uncharacterized protein LOC121532642 isoform X1 [Coregonus clupeaformis]|uniref:uncharacterized protein LOC121532642 isoform X1 n=1 Tax=Coregonus clupeaformis TaxID=59861 RepID=UPI001BE067B6|nr:uncharacterized protein LOC121532642 isoform X1 [Coregonus clupeaformis]